MNTLNQIEEQATKLCYAIQQFPASTQQTNTEIMASDLAQKIRKYIKEASQPPMPPMPEEDYIGGQFNTFHEKQIKAYETSKNKIPNNLEHPECNGCVARVENLLEKKDSRQWVCLKCGYINDYDSKKCMSCGIEFNGTQPRTKGEKVLIVYDKDNVTDYMPLRDRSCNWVETKKKE